MNSELFKTFKKAKPLLSCACNDWREESAYYVLRITRYTLHVIPYSWSSLPVSFAEIITVTIQHDGYSWRTSHGIYLCLLICILSGEGFSLAKLCWCCEIIQRDYLNLFLVWSNRCLSNQLTVFSTIVLNGIVCMLINELFYFRQGHLHRSHASLALSFRVFHFGWPTQKGLACFLGLACFFAVSAMLACWLHDLKDIRVSEVNFSWTANYLHTN